MTDRETYEGECQTIEDFSLAYEFAWERFALLGAIDADLYGLNRFRWKASVENKTEVKGKLRRWTGKVAALIKNNEKDVLATLGNPAKRQSAEQSTKAMLLYQRMTLTGSTPEELCALALQLSGDHGLWMTGGHLLREAFQREATNHLDSAMILLPTLIYIGYRYQKTDEFRRTVNQVATSMEYHRKPGSSCDPVVHALCLSQLACTFSERREKKRAADLFDDSSVRELINSTGEIPWPRPQLLRGRASFYAVRSSQLHAAQEDFERCKEWEADSNKRAMATLQHNILAKASRPRFVEAWDVLKPFHNSGLNTLETAMQQRRTQLRDLAHLFPSVYLGAIMRHLAGDTQDKDALAKDTMVLDWCYQHYGVMLLDDPDAFDRKYLLPQELCVIRDKCMRQRLTADELASLDRLVTAIKEIPH